MRCCRLRDFEKLQTHAIEAQIEMCGMRACAAAPRRRAPPPAAAEAGRISGTALERIKVRLT